jgi:hypothetical protein
MQWYPIFLFKWNLILTKSIDEKTWSSSDKHDNKYGQNIKCAILKIDLFGCPINLV